MNYLNIITTMAAVLIIGSTFAQPNYPTDPNKAEYISVDIKNFIEAYNALGSTTDSVATIQAFYLDNASPGLTEYINRFNLTAESIIKSIKEHPDAYNKIEGFYAGLEEFNSEYTALMNDYKKVIPSTMFPPSYFLVADYKGIGQASRYGQLISIEKKLVDDREKLKDVITHELTHFQQAMIQGFQQYVSIYSKPNNMIDLILREGTADFVTHKLVRNNQEKYTKLSNYEKNESELWKKFQEDLKNQNKDYWLNVSYENDNNGVPIQMGYGLGYKLINNYYEMASDKESALLEILKMPDANMFYEHCQYLPN